MARSWLFGIVGTAVCLLLIWLAGAVDSVWLSFPIFLVSIAVLALAGDQIKKHTSSQGRS